MEEVVQIIGCTICGVACYFLAKKQGRNPILGAILGVIFTIISVIVYLVIGKKKSPEERPIANLLNDVKSRSECSNSRTYACYDDDDSDDDYSSSSASSSYSSSASSSRSSSSSRSTSKSSADADAKERARRQKEREREEAAKAKKRKQERKEYWQRQIAGEQSRIDSCKRDIENLRNTLKNNPNATASSKASWRNNIEYRKKEIAQYKTLQDGYRRAMKNEGL